MGPVAGRFTESNTAEFLGGFVVVCFYSFFSGDERPSRTCLRGNTVQNNSDVRQQPARAWKAVNSAESLRLIRPNAEGPRRPQGFDSEGVSCCFPSEGICQTRRVHTPVLQMNQELVTSPSNSDKSTAPIPQTHYRRVMSSLTPSLKNSSFGIKGGM